MIKSIYIIYKVFLVERIPFGGVDFPVSIKRSIYIVIYIAFAVGTIMGRHSEKNALNLDFPFKNGKYIITFGGDGKNLFSPIIIIIHTNFKGKKNIK